MKVYVCFQNVHHCCLCYIFGLKYILMSSQHENEMKPAISRVQLPDSVRSRGGGGESLSK